VEPNRKKPSLTSALLFFFTALSGLGGAACILQYFGIQPKDIGDFMQSTQHVLWLVSGLVLLAISGVSYTLLLKRFYTDRAKASFADESAAFARYKEGVEDALQKKSERISELARDLSTVTRERDHVLANAEMWQRNSAEDRAELQATKASAQRVARQLLDLPDGISTDGPNLWIDYKPKGVDPDQSLEVLVFSVDKGQAIKVKEIGPLVWRRRHEFKITPCTAIGVIRESVACVFITFERLGVNADRSFSLPDGYREMMRRFGLDAQPTLDVICEDMDGNRFLKRFILSIDPFDGIVLEPVRLAA
jgi:hypothetical protein